jgi:hypothetical protein
MSDAPAAVRIPAGTAPAVPSAERSGLAELRDTVAAEWMKLRTLRSSSITLVAAFVSMLGISALICWAFAHHYASLPPLEQAVERVTLDASFISVSGIFLAQLPIGVLGVLTMSSEFATGLVRATFAAVPRRMTLVAAKAIVFAAVSLVIGMVGSFASFAIGQAVLSSQGIQTTLGAPGVLRVVIGGGLYLPVLGLLGLGLGAMIRRTAGGVAALFGLLLVLPVIASVLPAPWGPDIQEYLPNQAGSALLHASGASDLLAPWTGFGVFCAYAAVALAVGALLVQRRDA